MLQARSSAAATGPLAPHNRIRASDHRASTRMRPHTPERGGLPPTVERSTVAGAGSPHFQLWSPEAPGAVAGRPAIPEDSFGSTRPVPHLADPDEEPYYPEVGTLISGFALVDELGRGSSARVFLARERLLGDRLVVLKVCRRVGAEAEALALLSHPNIVPIYSVREMPSHGLRLICMPFVPGESLSAVLESRGCEHPPLSARRPAARPDRQRRDAAHGSGRPVGAGGAADRAGTSRLRAALGKVKSTWSRAHRRHVAHEGESALKGPHARPIRFEPLPVNLALDIAIPLADALAHAHAHGVLHRDVKPSNVILTESGRPVLIDFHLSTLPRDATDGDRASLLGGTLAYMAPEHIRAFNPIGGGSPSDVDERSDLYGLGLILYEMLAGRPAFEEPALGMPTTQRLTRMADARRNNPPPSPRAENPLVPLRLDAVVAKCLAPDPDRRYGSAAEFRDELIRIRDNRRLRLTREPCPIALSLALLRGLGRPLRRPAAVAGLLCGFALGTTASCAIGTLWR